MDGEDMTLWNEENPPRRLRISWWGWLITLAVGLAVAFLTYEWGRGKPLAFKEPKPALHIAKTTREWSDYLPKQAKEPETDLTPEEQSTETPPAATEDAKSGETEPYVPPSDDVAGQIAQENPPEAVEAAPPAENTISPEPVPAPVPDTSDVDALKQELKTLEERVAALEKEKQVQAQSAPIYERLYRLRVKMENGERVDEVLAALKDLPLGEDQKALLVMLEDLNQQGVPSRPVLARAFSERADQFASAPDSQSDTLSEAKSWLKKQIVIRKVGDTHSGNDDGSIIARAEAEVKAGKFKEALSETDNLSSGAQHFFADWRAQAERRLQADSLLQQLEQSLAVPPRAEP